MITTRYNCTQQMGIVGKAISKIKQLARSKEVRALIKYDLEDDCGKPTKEGRALVLRNYAEELWATKRIEIGASLVKSDKEEKDEAKGDDN